jgi:hypothetical protein
VRVNLFAHVGLSVCLGESFGINISMMKVVLYKCQLARPITRSFWYATLV